MKNIIIRNIKREDIFDVVDIQINGWKTAYKGIVDDEYLQAMSREERIKKREQDYMQNGFIVAESNKKVIGFCRYIDNNSFSKDIQEADCELLALYVEPNLKYSGIGTKLFQYVTQEFKNRGREKMILWCLKDNEASKKFYTKMGGKIIKEREISIGENDYKEICFLYSI